MRVSLTEVRYVSGYRLSLSFADGRCGELDLRPDLCAEPYDSLLQLEVFRLVQLDSERNRLRWPNGLDLLGAWLYAQLDEVLP